MTERERWVVYPLLFLALGASLRDKFPPSRTTSKIIECEELRIVDADQLGEDLQPRPLVRIGQTPSSAGAAASGLVVVNGDARVDGQLIVQNVPVVPALQNMGQGLDNIRQGLQILFGGTREQAPPRQGRPRQPPVRDNN
jgi:hypothetical protein